MANLRYEESHRIGQWDLLAVLGALTLAGILVTGQLLLTGHTDPRYLLPLALTILVLSGLMYYLYHLRLVARYSEKSIKLSMMPVGTVTRKIRWDDVVKTEIVITPRGSRVNQWANQLSGLGSVVTPAAPASLHLRLRNNEEITIGCHNPEALRHLVDQVRQNDQDQAA